MLGLSQSAVSHQLRLLRNIRLVRPRRDGRIVFYSLDDQHIMSIFKQTLQHVEEEQRLPSASRSRRTASARSARRDDDDSAAAQSQAHIGCNHCETDTPAPTGARVRGWFTAVAGDPRDHRLCHRPGSRRSHGGSHVFWSPPPSLARSSRRSAPGNRSSAFSLDINVLMVIAVIGAMAIGEYEEAAMVVTLFAAAQWLEAQSLDRARQAIGRLLDLAPSDVLVRDDAGERLIGIELVTPGALMIVRPGEKFALDGIVRNGHSDVNQAPITGESLPVEKAEGDEVFAGTINGHGALTVAVTRRRRDTTLARIVNLVESAQAKRAPMQTFIDRFAAWYTPAVVVLAVLVAAVPLVVADQSFDTWLYRALVLLVVSCPCALVISTPVSIVSALAGAARQGVLVKGGIHLERLATVRVVAFDKTGTVTTGDLTLDAVRPLDGHSENEVIAAAASVESQSEHPIAAAILTRSTQPARPAANAATMCGHCRGSALKGVWRGRTSCAARRGCSRPGTC